MIRQHVRLTCECVTHQAEVTTLASHAALLQIAMVPASFRVLGGTGDVLGFFMITLLAPCKSACTYKSAET